MVTYCNKNFVATNCSNNIFCCNKVFLIIKKIFYYNQTLLQKKNLLQQSIAIDFITGNKKFSVAIDLKLIATKKFRCNKGFFSCSDL